MGRPGAERIAERSEESPHLFHLPRVGSGWETGLIDRKCVDLNPKTMWLAASVLCAALCGCGPQSRGGDGPTPVRGAANAALPAPSADGAPYDFYLLNLSWSPEFCYSHPDSPECAAHPGFVVHGLWPQNTDGSYPEHCPSRPGPVSDQVWAGLMPTRPLAEHEWQTHGTCTPYAVDAYFSVVRRAYESVKIPAQFTSTTQQTMEPPTAIVDAFARINTGFPAGSIALSCGNNRLTAIEVCFDKKLQPMACSGIRTCRANNVKITPQASAGE
jgi:ribonuclease T2